MSISILVQPVGIENLKRLRQVAESLAGALASKATDKLRVSVVDTLPRSPFYLTDSSGNELSGYVKNLDAALSSRASEATLSALKNALASVGTDKLRATVVDALPLSPFNLTQIGGTSLTGRDWSQDFAKLQNLDAALSSRASESTLSAIAGALASRATDKLRVSVVDSLPRSPFTLYDSAGNELSSYVKNLDTALSSFTGSAGSSPPSKAIPILGFDGTYLRLLKTTADGKLLAVLG